MSLVSADLQAANERLLALRARQQVGRVSPVPSRSMSSSPITTISELPPHLGWGSQPLADTLRQARQRRQERQSRLVGVNLAADSLNTQTVSSVSTKEYAPSPSPTIRFHPDLGLALLRSGQVAAGRVWLLLRHLDRQGRGWFRIEVARACLTQPPLSLCGERQLRSLLRTGEGVFWQQRNGRLWLRSLAKVAWSLGITRLRSRPIALPLSVLYGRIGHTRAHFYAAAHSGRRGMPISRETLTRLSGVAAAAQRRYEQIAGVQVQTNIALGPRLTAENQEVYGWQQGQALFALTDYQGRHGRPGETYLAWQLPNSYLGPHPMQARTAQRRLNRQLATLWTKRDMGTGAVRRLFYADAVRASRAEADAYWPSGHQERAVQWWYVLPAEKDPPSLGD